MTIGRTSRAQGYGGREERTKSDQRPRHSQPPCVEVRRRARGAGHAGCAIAIRRFARLWWMSAHSRAGDSTNCSPKPDLRCDRSLPRTPGRTRGQAPDIFPTTADLEKRLRTLLDHGHADAIVQLGEELVQRGIDQIEQSHDDGETVRAIGDCMEIVYEALLQSSRRDEDKIIYAIDMVLADEYGLCACLRCGERAALEDGDLVGRGRSTARTTRRSETGVR